MKKKADKQTYIIQSDFNICKMMAMLFVFLTTGYCSSTGNSIKLITAEKAETYFRCIKSVLLCRTNYVLYYQNSIDIYIANYILVFCLILLAG